MRTSALFQFLKLWMGAGILPPRLTKSAHPYPFTGMMPASPRRPPNWTLSPTSFPMTGMILTAVVFWLTMPMAISSAMIPAIVVAGTCPGTAIMSRPTEQTQVMASSFSRVSAPISAASRSWRQ